jgi:hygromycin-B 4-O-kinase
MSHKTEINIEVIRDFLTTKFNGNVSKLEFISGGESSQAFGFNVHDEEFVIRIDQHNPDGFKKDEYAYKNFSSEDIIVPKVIEIDKLGEKYYFCISKRAEGQTLEKFSDVDRKRLLPPLLQVLDKIHAINIKDKAGYGKWNNTGNASCKSWRDTLLAVDQYVWGTDTNPNYFETCSFLDQNLWEAGYARLEELIAYCPEERYLIHGDAGSDNVLSDGFKITAVIDWADSQYGDFLLDVSRLIFWSDEVDYQKICRTHYEGKNISHLDERLLCYQIHTALNSLSFYAYSEQETKALISAKKLRNLISVI